MNIETLTYSFMFSFFLNAFALIIFIVCFKAIKFRLYSLLMTARGYGIISRIGADRRLKEDFIKFDDTISLEACTYNTSNDVVLFKGNIPLFFYREGVADPLNLIGEYNTVNMDIKTECTECQKEIIVNASLNNPFKVVDSETYDNIIKRALTAGGLKDFLRKNKIILVLLIGIAAVVAINLILTFTTQSMIEEATRAGASLVI